MILPRKIVFQNILEEPYRNSQNTRNNSLFLYSGKKGKNQLVVKKRKEQTIHSKGRHSRIQRWSQ